MELKKYNYKGVNKKNIMSKWFEEFEIQSKKVDKIKDILLDTFDFENIIEEDLLTVENDKLVIECYEGCCFWDKESHKLPSIEDIFVSVCKNISDLELSAFVEEVDSFDGSGNDYKINFDDEHLVIKTLDSNGDLIKESDLLRSNNFEDNDINYNDNKSYNYKDSNSFIDYFINDVKIYELPCLPSVFILEDKSNKYFLEVYFDMGYLLIDLYNETVNKKLITIENSFDDDQQFTEDISIKEFRKLEEEIKKTKIDICDIRLATEEELLKFLDCIANNMY